MPSSPFLCGFVVITQPISAAQTQPVEGGLVLNLTKFPIRNLQNPRGCFFSRVCHLVMSSPIFHLLMMWAMWWGFVLLSTPKNGKKRVGSGAGNAY